MKFQIQKNVPIPNAGGRAPRTEYPFEQMEVGDSFFVPGMTVKKMSGQVGYWKKTMGMNFAIRAVTEDYMNDDGEVVSGDGVRVWREDPSKKTNRGRKPKSVPPAGAQTEGDEGQTEGDEGQTEGDDTESTEGDDTESTEGDDTETETPAEEVHSRKSKSRRKAAEETEY